MQTRLDFFTIKSPSLLPDPYGLLQVAQPTQPLADLPGQIEQYDLAQVPVESYEEPKEGIIPKRMNYIYIVNPIDACTPQNNHLETIALFKKLYPDYITTLWITSSAYTPEQQQSLINWAKINKIHLIDSSILDGHIGPSEQMYQLELLRRNYAAATDQLRLAILYHFGGIYSDVDVVADPDPLHRLPEELKAPQGLYIHKGDVRFTRSNQHPLDVYKMAKRFGDSPESYCQIHYGCSNDFILAVRHCHILQKIQEKIASKYLVPAAELLKEVEYQNPSSGAYLSFDPDRPWPTQGFLKQWTIEVTGPTSLNDIYEQEFPQLDDAIEQNERFLRSFYFTNELSWLKLKKEQIAFPEKATEIVVTSLLYDLTMESGSLRLDRYMAFLSKEQMVDVLKILSQQYPKQLENVKFVFPYDKSIHSLLLSHRDQFPALSQSLFTEADEVKSSPGNNLISTTNHTKLEKTETPDPSTVPPDKNTPATLNRHGFFQPVIEFFEKINPSKSISGDLRVLRR
ncbi:TcdA/TcdB catalytic glycosyltransferase domain-containing protein [Legionella longbeachae]|uniref:TcdA/TcdB catalytic glycosyltransferase domain-containing protein n=1 Tax=Legionella longbeachae TaxID=450 RepID=UPI001246FABF|nr:TcdA/TcdB catalytic glycosyltransferase domain-containing protein [Legionella longbeachae]QEY52937.1 glycosyl transferase [Legionella longbeachae]